MKNEATKQEMKKAASAIAMFLDTLFEEMTTEQEKTETTTEKSHRLFCNSKKQAQMLKITEWEKQQTKKAGEHEISSLDTRQARQPKIISSKFCILHWRM